MEYIQSCVIMDNGDFTKDFEMKRGTRQGDPV